MAPLAWTLKAWMALALPVQPRWADQHVAERDRWLRMEFRTFGNFVVDIPAQGVRTARQLVIHALGWRRKLPVLFRLVDAQPARLRRSRVANRQLDLLARSHRAGEILVLLTNAPAAARGQLGVRLFEA
jgi:hypothetical protein